MPIRHPFFFLFSCLEMKAYASHQPSSWLLYETVVMVTYIEEVGRGTPIALVIGVVLAAAALLYFFYFKKKKAVN